MPTLPTPDTGVALPLGRDAPPPPARLLPLALAWAVRQELAHLVDALAAAEVRAPAAPPELPPPLFARPRL